MTDWLRIGAILVVLTLSGPLMAQESPADWRWFEVEVLVFKHHENSDLESFPWHAPRQFNPAIDLLTPHYAPNYFGYLNGLPLCPEPTDDDFNFVVLCAKANEIDPFAEPWYQPEHMLSRFQSAPQTIIDGQGGDIYTSTTPFLMARDNHLFNGFRQQLVRRGVGEPLLHLSYRLPVFTRDRGQTIRLFGGRNYGHEFLTSGYPVPPLQDVEDATTDFGKQQLFDELNQLFEQISKQQLQLSYRDHGTPNPLSLSATDDVGNLHQPVWELDGLLHIYLVGNYLHIDSDLELRVPQTVRFNQRELAGQIEHALRSGQTTSQFLRSYRLNQLRRVISHETHYFDHPKLGLVVQIRRTDLSARR